MGPLRGLVTVLSRVRSFGRGVGRVAVLARRRIINTFNDTVKDAVVARVQPPDTVELTEPLGIELPVRSLVLRPYIEATKAPEPAPPPTEAPPTPPPTEAPTLPPTPLAAVAEETQDEMDAASDVEPPPPPPSKSAAFGPLQWLSVVCAVVTTCICCLLIGFFISRPSEPVKRAAKKADDKDKVRTKLKKLSMPGDNKILVDDVGQFRPGQTAHIESDMGREEARILEVGPGSFVLAEGLRNIHPIGATVTADLHEEDAHGHHAEFGLQTPRRQSKIADLFHTLDSNGNGFVSCEEMFRLAQADGFPGDQEQWKAEFQRLVHSHFQSSDTGCSLSNFALLVDDREHGIFLSDYDLENYLSLLCPTLHDHGHLHDDGPRH
ncbi:unnamed protein product [Prorocentrum cordatum]|uniref:EF-hand domain-containing protein n=1 Tax=Prorocentrum cordatum TaxID=2364126 RepID=A0ABN9RZE9_9DINO|nr:unnamed protein product [Polarella glacialis]